MAADNFYKEVSNYTNWQSGVAEKWWIKQEAVSHIGQDNLPSVESVVDLGVTVDKNIKFSEHIGKIVRKASTRCYLIKKCFLSKHTPTLLNAFKTYVRPLLEYNSPIWSPHLLKDINSIEKVQRRFTKSLRGLYNLSYDERLSQLQLERLETRRIQTDIITTYKIIFGKTILNPGDFFTLNDCPIDTRGHPYKLIPPLSTTLSVSQNPGWIRKYQAAY